MICFHHGDKSCPEGILRNSYNCLFLVKKLPFINTNLSNFLKSSRLQQVIPSYTRHEWPQCAGAGAAVGDDGLAAAGLKRSRHGR